MTKSCGGRARYWRASRPVILRWGERARRELQDAAAFLNGRGGELGDEFLAEVDHLLLLLQSNPRIGMRAGHGRRVILENRFRYRIVYRILREEVRIIAVAHQKQRPGYWRGRIEEPRIRYAA